MKRDKSILVFLLTMAFFVTTAIAKDTYRIKYISGENIYLDSGSADSLTLGDRLAIKSGDSTVAVVEIAFLAANSSSCKVISKSGEPMVGDSAVLVYKTPRPLNNTASQPESTQTPIAGEPEQSISSGKTQLTRLDGNLAFQFYKWDDRNASNLDFTQPAMRFNLKASQIAGKNLTLNIRTTSRHNQRTRAYNASVPKSEWRNRIYKLSLAYADERAPLYFEAGRIISTKISGIGYIDGLLVQKSLSGKFQLGGFGGTQPEWQYSDYQTSLQKFGAYFGFSDGDIKLRRVESTLALAGEYHGWTVSREFAYLRNNINLNNRWNIFQSAEIDFNRDWRKQKSGHNLSLSNFYLSGRGRLTEKLSAGVSYDNRKNYWTYETRSIADSLFDDILRRGLRADLSIRPSKSMFLTVNYGINKRTGDSKATSSFGLGINRSGLIPGAQNINIQLSGFSGPFTDGYNFASRLGHNFRNGNSLTLGYSAYVYKFGSGGLRRKNQALAASGQISLLAGTFLSASYEYNTGDDTNGNRIIGELGYRF